MYRLKTASARTSNVNAVRINFGTRQQVIERAHTIPNFPAREISASEIRQVAHHGVLGADQIVTTLFGFRVPELTSFSLSHRVPADHNVTMLH